MNEPLVLINGINKNSSSSTVDLDHDLSRELSQESSQDINSSDFKLSTERGRHLIAPFELESQNYECQCKSCLGTQERRPIFSRICIFGIICPLLWFYEISLCLYLQWFIPHEPTYPPIDSDQLPTEYELENRRKRTEIGIDPLTLQDIKITNGPIKGSNELPFQTSVPPEREVGCGNEMGSGDKLKRAQFHFLRQVSTQIVDSHRQVRSCLWKWIWFSAAAIASYGLVLAAILATVVRGS